MDPCISKPVPCVVQGSTVCVYIYIYFLAFSLTSQKNLLYTKIFKNRELESGIIIDTWLRGSANKKAGPWMGRLARPDSRWEEQMSKLRWWGSWNSRMEGSELCPQKQRPGKKASPHTLASGGKGDNITAKEELSPRSQPWEPSCRPEEILGSSTPRAAADPTSVKVCAFDPLQTARNDYSHGRTSHPDGGVKPALETWQS